ncbi:EAL domain-containing protein [Burkholderia gladioli]|uniref:EAL domain-containing protein n=1 Tax=Burkholderia gladioli TaxID=28095 RepID=UPI003F7A8CB4
MRSGVSDATSQRWLAPIDDKFAALGVIGAALDGKLKFKLRPVCSLANESDVLYWESEVQVQIEGVNYTQTRFGASVERSGFARWFDGYVVRHALGILREYPEKILLCNVFDESLISDVFWRPVFDLLEAEPDIAVRLILGVANVNSLSHPDCKNFVERLSMMGCRIAVKVNLSQERPIQNMKGLYSYIVRVERRLMDEACEGGAGEKKLLEMLCLINAASHVAVLEGIDAECSRLIALRSGAKWGKGRQLGGNVFADDGRGDN